MRCPNCQSEDTSLSWLRESSIIYWCRRCLAGFEVERAAVQSTARPVRAPVKESADGVPVKA